MTCQVPSVAYCVEEISILIEREFVITPQSHHNKHDDDALSFYAHKRHAKVIARLLLLHA